MQPRFRNPPVPDPTRAAAVPYPFDRPDWRQTPEFASYGFLPRWYTVKVFLGHEAGDNQPGSKQIDIFDFVLYRITWATNGDLPPFIILDENAAFPPGGSYQGRCVEVSIRDNYTIFVPEPSLVCALFGDSNGYLDIPQGMRLQGKSTLRVDLTRINYPGTVPEGAPPQSRWDFTFHGVDLLPPGVPVSGSTG